MNEIVSLSHTKTDSPKPEEFAIHIHDSCEILHFISGNASFFAEGSIYPLHRGDLVITRSIESHYIMLHSDAVYERDVLHFSAPQLKCPDPDGKIHAMFYERPAGKFNRFPSAAFPENMWGYYLNKIAKTENGERKLIYFYAFLDELSECYERLRILPEDSEIDRSTEIIRYIDRHLFDEISLDSICRRFFISQPHLSRIFKKNTGLTVWNYITGKRLVCSGELLRSGIHPTKVAQMCGYSNYVSFYKAYRKAFGTAPSQSRPVDISKNIRL